MCLLKKQGFKCCEPSWITKGKKPDLFCTGPAEIWVEVKSLGETPAREKASELHSWFDSRRQIDRPGARVSAFYALERSDVAQYDYLVVTIPRDPYYKEDTEFFLFIDKQNICIISARAADGSYGCPFIGGNVHIDSNHPVRVREAGSERETTAGQLGLDGEDLRLALIVTPWTYNEVSLSGSSEIGGAEIGWPDRPRLLNGAKDAAKQFRNALKHKVAPTVIFYVSEFDSPASCIIRIESLTAMLYGEPILVGDGPSVIYGRGAFLTNNKNTSVSAACYISGCQPICVLHNPWAKGPLPTGLFGCPEYRGLEKGKITRVF